MEEILSKTVGEIVAADFRTAKVFEKYGIDFCCGGNMKITEVCNDKDVDLSKIAGELEAAKAEAAGNSEDYSGWSLAKLVGHIVRVHHTYLYKNVRMIATYADKIAQVHGRNHTELKEIARIFTKMSEDLMVHLRTEEDVLFPAIRRIEGGTHSSEDLAILRFTLQGLGKEHEEVGEAMHTIRRLSGNYALPRDACNTFALTYSKLEEFEDDLHKHVHLENNILFPKMAAIAIAA